MGGGQGTGAYGQVGATGTGITAGTSSDLSTLGNSYDAAAKANAGSMASQQSTLSLPSWITQQGGTMPQTGQAGALAGALGNSILAQSGGGTPSAPTGETGGGGVTPLPGSPGAFQLAGPTTGGPGTNLVGAPPWMQDFYAQGGGDLNAYWQKMAGQVNTQQQPAAPTQTFAKPKAVVKPVVKPAVKPAVKAAVDPNDPSKYTMIPMNAAGGYNQPGMQYAMSVSDQWNPSTGSSNQIAMSRPGTTPAPQVMGGPIYTDNKGGYFAKDAKTGKIVPITNATALAAAKGVGKSFGYA